MRESRYVEKILNTRCCRRGLSSRQLKKQKWREYNKILKRRMKLKLKLKIQQNLRILLFFCGSAIPYKGAKTAFVIWGVPWIKKIEETPKKKISKPLEIRKNGSNVEILRLFEIFEHFATPGTPWTPCSTPGNFRTIRLCSLNQKMSFNQWVLDLVNIFEPHGKTSKLLSFIDIT